ncbi:MAG TPA: S9 family peptidase [Gemmatimonadaceae bacterium]|nr:S9 family peptidase [Gemmatimonadaceae bacterium]
MKRLMLGVTIGAAITGFVMRNSPILYAQSLRAASPAADSLPRLIPLEALFAAPAAQWGGISPDGRWLSYIKPWKGRQNVFVRAVGSTAERAITRDSVRSVPAYWWSADGKRILWVQDRAGDENYHLHVASVSDLSAEPRDLTPFKNVEVEVLALPHATPNIAIITMNRRNPALADVYRVDLATGALELAVTNPGTFLGYAADRDNQVRAAYAVDSAGHYQLWARASESAAWRMVKSYAVEDRITLLRFARDGRLYAVSSERTDLARLVLIDLETGRESVVDSDPLGKVDLDRALFDEASGELLMTRYVGDTARLYAKTPRMQALLRATRRAGGGVVEMGGGTTDQSRWVVTMHTPTRAAVTYLYSASGGLEKFLEPRPGLRSYRLASMAPIAYTARDGLSITGYLTLPPGRAPRGLPLVVLVHGGPWGARDSWQFDPQVQLLANRGYAVLQANYRGTTGLGKKFARAAKKEFGRAMSTDLLDGVDYLSRGGTVDATRVGIMGGSYGGYATLVGLTFTPDRYACGVDYVGMSNLVTLLESFPPSWRPFLPRSWYPFVGDPRDPADRADMISRSPLFRADSARSPLLIFQGANDPRVTKTQSDQIALALNRRRIPVTYLFAANEGHGFAEAETALAVNRATEQFLGRCLGGRVQPSVSPRVEAALRAMLVNVDTLRAR